MITADTKGFKTIKRPIEVQGGKPTSVSIPMQKGKGVIMLGLDGLPATAPAPPKGGRAAPVRTPRYTPAPAAGGGGGGGGRAYVKGKAIRVRGKIAFQGETATLTSKSKSLLNSVAAVMKKNKKIKKVRVGAHTDGRGDAAAKRTLSIKRAQTVKSYLVSRGVARNRLSTKGFGPDKPIAPNMSARGRAQNNRVDLAILEMGQ
jgi:outer membrane protein OmpA-like peptidoglycan-associated protein